MILISTKYGYILLNQLQHVSQGLEAIWGVEVDPSHRSKNARQVCGECCIAGNSCGLPMPSASSEFKAPNFWDFSNVDVQGWWGWKTYETCLLG